MAKKRVFINCGLSTCCTGIAESILHYLSIHCTYLLTYDIKALYFNRFESPKVISGNNYTSSIFGNTPLTQVHAI